MTSASGDTRAGHGLAMRVAATVRAEPSIQPAGDKRFMIAWMPPAWYTSSR